MKSSTLSLPHDESALLDGMDEDGSFIGDVTFAIDDRSDVVNIWTVSLYTSDAADE